MKKIILSCLAIALATACGSSASQQTDETAAKENPVVSQPVEVKTPQEEGKSETKAAPTIQNSMLLGKIEKNDFLSPPFDTWFNSGYDRYTPEPEVMNKIKSGIPEVDSILVYMGTWCGDSRREVPKFFKILDAADFDLRNVQMIAVDRRKDAPDGSHEVNNIQRVPTFIFYKDGEEIGRFVERPRETLEQDLAKIISGEEYKHSYEH